MIMRALHEKDLTGPTYVYCLFDPRNRRPFYIGISKYQWYRFEQHKQDPSSSAWAPLNALLQKGFSPQCIYKIYKKCPNRNAALELEHRLINSTPGLVNCERRLQRRSAVGAS